LAKAGALALQNQIDAIRQAWNYFEGNLMRLTEWKVFALHARLVVMCFAPFNYESAAGEGQATPGGAGCRLANLGQDWGYAASAAEAEKKAATAEAALAAAKTNNSVPELFPELPWGTPQHFLEISSSLGRLEVVRLSDERFLACFEHGSDAMVSCRFGAAEAGSEVPSFGSRLDLGPGRMVSLTATRAGKGFAICRQDLALGGAPQSGMQVSCRFGEVDSGSGELRLLEDEKPLEFSAG